MNTKFKDFPVSVKNRNELVDYDYTAKLDDASYVWLMRFTAEYTNANFDSDEGTLLNNEQVSDAYLRNNRRNRDIYSYKRNHRQLMSITTFGRKVHKNGSTASYINGEQELDGVSFDEDYMTTSFELKKIMKQYE